MSNNFTINNLKKYIKNTNNSYKLLNLNYSKIETKCINEFDISNKKLYMHLGKINLPKLKTFLLGIGNNKSDQVEILIKLIYKIFNIVINSYENEYFSFEIRTWIPDNLYNIPRWHIDTTESFASSTSVLLTLKGPGTLLMKTNKNIINIYQANQQKLMKNLDDDNYMKIINKYKNILAKKLDIYPSFCTTNNQVIIFDTNNQIHSEPDIISERFIIKITPATKLEIKAQIERLGASTLIY